MGEEAKVTVGYVDGIVQLVGCQNFEVRAMLENHRRFFASGEVDATGGGDRRRINRSDFVIVESFEFRSVVNMKTVSGVRI